LRVIDKRS